MSKRGHSLALFKPTEAELDAARKILEASDEKQVRAKMQSMANFLRRNAESEGNDAAASSRGESRREYLLRYMAFQFKK